MKAEARTVGTGLVPAPRRSRRSAPALVLAKPKLVVPWAVRRWLVEPARGLLRLTSAQLTGLSRVSLAMGIAFRVHPGRY